MSTDGFENLDGADDDVDPAVAAAAADKAAADKAADAADEDDDADDLAVEVERGGEKVRMAPVSSIVKHRKAARAASESLAAEQRKSADLEAKLAKVSGDVEKLNPLLKALQTRPDLVDAAMRGTKPSSVDNPANHDADPAMIELAKEMELFDADGKPDAARAARISSRFSKDADAKAEAKVKPLIDQQVHGRANQNKAQLYKWADEGHVTKDGVDKAIAMLPGAEALLAHDGVRDVLYFMAKGMSPAQAKAAAAAGGTADDPPLHVERPGGRGKTPIELPAFSKRIAERRGKSTAEWAKAREQDGDVLE